MVVFLLAPVAEADVVGASIVGMRVAEVWHGFVLDLPNPGALPEVPDRLRLGVGDLRVQVEGPRGLEAWLESWLAQCPGIRPCSR